MTDKTKQPPSQQTGDAEPGSKNNDGDLPLERDSIWMTRSAQSLDTVPSFRAPAQSVSIETSSDGVGPDETVPVMVHAERQSSPRETMPSTIKKFKKHEVPERRVEMCERFEMGDFSLVLTLAEMLLEYDPEDRQAIDYQQQAKDRLLEIYTAHLGSPERTLTLAIDERDIIWRDLTPQDSFVLSQVDGQTPFSDLLDISGLPRFETCQILDRLLADGIIK